MPWLRGPVSATSRSSKADCGTPPRRADPETGAACGKTVTRDIGGELVPGLAPGLQLDRLPGVQQRLPVERWLVDLDILQPLAKDD